MNPSVAADADGDFVVAWASAVQDGSGFGVYAQRYSAAGGRRDGEFRVNVTTRFWQEHPSVAMDADGDFVVVWDNRENDFERDIYARRYSAGGLPRGGEIVVNTTTGGDQGRPSVAMSGGGEFVVVWDAIFQDGDGRGIFARRYTAAGVAMGGEIPVNTTTAGNQMYPSVAMDADGDFVAAWTGPGTGGSTTSIFVQRFSADDVAQGGELLVATVENVTPSLAIAMDADGDFVVAWGTSANQQGTLVGDVSARRYTAAGAAAGGAFVVNATLPGQQTDPSVAMDGDGNFVVAWASDDEGDGDRDVYLRHFNAAGAPEGGEVRVNTSTSGIQNEPAVAMDAGGGLVVAWHSNHPGSNAFDVYAQRFRRDDPPAVTGVFLGASAWSPAFRSLLQARGIGASAFGFSVPAASQLGIIPWAGIDQVSVRFSEDVTAGRDLLSVSGVNVADYPVTAYNYDAPTHTATWTLAQGLRNDKVLIRLEGDAGGVAGGGVLLDGEWTGNAGAPDAFPSGDGVPGGDFRFRINVLPGDVNGDRVVNAIDLLDLRRRLIPPGASQAAYSPAHDLNGDAAINAVDLAVLRRAVLSRLPVSEPATVFVAAVEFPRRLPIRRSLFADV